MEAPYNERIMLYLNEYIIIGSEVQTGQYLLFWGLKTPKCISVILRT